MPKVIARDRVLTHTVDPSFKNWMDNDSLETYLRPGDVFFVRYHPGALSGKIQATTIGHTFMAGPRNDVGLLCFCDAGKAGVLFGDFDWVRERYFYANRIFVARCMNHTLSAAAAVQAFKWSSKNDKAARAATVHVNIPSQIKGFATHRGKTFDDHSVRRAVNAAARRNLERPIEDQSILCTGFVVMCYQAAGLQHLVRGTMSKGLHLKNDWLENSDRLWMDPNFDAKSLTSTDKGYLKSALTQAMCCDYKYTTPSRLRDRITQAGSDWEWLGSFTHESLLTEPKTFFREDEIAFLEGQRVIKKRAADEKMSKTETVDRPAVDHYYAMLNPAPSPGFTTAPPVASSVEQALAGLPLDQLALVARQRH